MKNIALLVSGIIFFLVAVTHVVRLAFQVEITAAGHVVPMGLSVGGFLFAITVSAWMLWAMKERVA